MNINQNLDIQLNTKLTPYCNNKSQNNYLIYNTDKQLFIIFNRLITNDLGCLLLNKDNTKYINFFITANLIKKTKKMFGIPYCTYPIINLFHQQFKEDDWNLSLYNLQNKKIITELFLQCRILNYNFLKKHSYYYNIYKGSFINYKR